MKNSGNFIFRPYRPALHIRISTVSAHFYIVETCASMQLLKLLLWFFTAGAADNTFEFHSRVTVQGCTTIVNHYKHFLKSHPGLLNKRPSSHFSFFGFVLSCFLNSI